MKYKDALSEQIRGNSPVILLSLLEKERLHGYALAQEIERRSEGKIRLGEATIYPLLRNLEREELITGSWEISPTGRVRCRVYEITTLGLLELNNRRRTFDEFQAAMQMLIGRKQNVSTT